MANVQDCDGVTGSESDGLEATAKGVLGHEVSGGRETAEPVDLRNTGPHVILRERSP